MARRGYSNVATPLTVVGNLNNSDTSTVITLSGTPSGFPAVPYYAAIDLGTASEEVVYVTATGGSTVTATRGSSLSVPYGATTKSHTNGATFKHVSVAADFDEANAHVNASTGIHGLTGGAVDTAGGSTITASGAAVKGLVVKGAASQSANLQEWQDSTGTVIAKLLASNGALYAGVGVISPSLSYSGGQLSVTSGSAATQGIVVRGAASQSANLQEWQNSSGTVLTRIDNQGVIALGPSVSSSYLFNSPTSPENLLTATQTGHVPFALRGMASQTGNLQEWQSSAGTALSVITANGSLDFRSSGAQHVIGAGTGGASGTVVTVQGHDSSWKPLVCRGASGQSANLLECQNSGGTLLAGFNSGGRPIFNAGDYTTTTPTAGGAGALPAAPDRYLLIQLSDGSVRRIPVYP